jgi:hypothetical protein
VLEIGEDNVKLLVGRKSPITTVEEQAKASADNLKRFEGPGIAEYQSNCRARYSLSAVSVSSIIACFLSSVPGSVRLL